MPFPRLYTLMEPFGNMSPMGVLWASIGASPAYEIFAGCAEMLGGILLIVPRTTMLGALICLADMTQVFMLNMTYDVPVKLFSFHLILMSLFLLAPDVKRLLDMFFFNRPVQPSTQFPLFATPRANRIAVTRCRFCLVSVLMAHMPTAVGPRGINTAAAAPSRRCMASGMSKSSSSTDSLDRL